MMKHTQTTNSFFTAGGTLSLDATYVVRSTDEQLLRAASSGEYCNVLTPRQLGKSSLMVRTAKLLQQSGVRTAGIDLSFIGTKLIADEWYFGLISLLQEKLELKVDPRAWWDQHVHQGAVQRFSDFLIDVVLREIESPIVIFIDEIDSTLSLPFTDDFFAAIRAAYNARANNPRYKRLTFVLLGVANPADLIKDRSRTPYNIGLGIDLKDFTLQEASVTLLPGLRTISPQRAEAILKRVWYWTGGHPYLTQKVCAHIVSAENGQWSDERIDALVERLFLSDEARKESNLQYIGDRIRESHDLEKLLRTYRETYEGKPIEDEERDPIKSQLKLTGLLAVTSQGRLMVRNRIYKAVFDVVWVKQTMPTFTSRRVAIGAILIALVAVAFGVLVLTNQQSTDEIRAQELTDQFVEIPSSAVRITNLADLFNLGDEMAFASQARELFFGLNDEQQLSMFTNLDAPEQVGNGLQTVIMGISASAQLQNEAHYNEILQAMVMKLEEIENTEGFLNSRLLRAKLQNWLDGRRSSLENDHNEAVDMYSKAIREMNENPTIFWDRALSYTRLEDYNNALLDLSQVIELDSERTTDVSGLIQADPMLRTYLQDNQDKFPALQQFASN